MFGIRKSHLLLLVITWIVVHGVLLWMLGIRADFVDSKRYIAMADYFLTHGELEFFYQIFYAIPILLIAFFRFIFGEGIIAFIIFQTLVSGVAAMVIYRSSQTLFKRDAAGLVSAIIILTWLDCVQWNTAVMTESLAGSLICFVIYQLTHFRDAGRDFIVLFLLVTLCILTRPTGVLIGAGAVLFLLTRYWSILHGQPFLKFFTLFLLGMVAVLGAVVMLNEWDFTDQYLRGNIVTYMDTLQGRAHYYGNLRLDTSGLVSPPAGMAPVKKIIFFAFHNPVHFTKAAVLKVIYMVTFLRPYFSVLHNVYTVAWLGLVYVLFYRGFMRVADKPVRNFCVAVIIANCLLVAVSAADWDNRFYMLMQPGIALLAGGGGLHLILLLRQLPRRNQSEEM